MDMQRQNRTRLTSHSETRRSVNHNRQTQAPGGRGNGGDKMKWNRIRKAISWIVLAATVCAALAAAPGAAYAAGAVGSTDGTLKQFYRNNYETYYSSAVLADVVHDGKNRNELIVFSVPELSYYPSNYTIHGSLVDFDYLAEGMDTYQVFVYQVGANGTVSEVFAYNEAGIGSTRGGLFLYREDATDYLLEFAPVVRQGQCDFSYDVFSLRADGTRETMIGGQWRKSYDEMACETGAEFYAVFNDAGYRRFIEDAAAYVNAATPIMAYFELYNLAERAFTLFYAYLDATLI